MKKQKKRKKKERREENTKLMNMSPIFWMLLHALTRWVMSLRISLWRLTMVSMLANMTCTSSRVIPCFFGSSRRGTKYTCVAQPIRLTLQGGAGGGGEGG